MAPETLERRLMVAGVEAVRQLGGDALVQLLLARGDQSDLANADGPQRVPLADYLRFRDSALELLQDGFCATAFETGRILARGVINENAAQLRALTTLFEHAPNKLPLIGQAAVLGAHGNPGVVRASMRGADLLVISIENCPECRGLKRDSAFCFLNQGLISELAEGYLRVRVSTEETKCISIGDRACEIQVGLGRGRGSGE